MPAPHMMPAPTATAGNRATHRPVARPEAAADPGALPQRLLVLLDDLDLALVVLGDDRSVEGVDQVLVVVQRLDRLVVGLGVVQRSVRRGERGERVQSFHLTAPCGLVR